MYLHQKDIIDQSSRYKLLAWACGLGKTMAAIRLAEKNSNRCLIISPKSLTKNWEREIEKWGTQKEFKWKIVTKENFRKDWKILAQENFDGLICDELHFFLGIKSMMSKNLIKYLKQVKPNCLYGLTATPYTSSPWSVFMLETIFGKNPNYADYRYRYFNDVKMGSRYIPVVKKGIEKEIAQKIKAVGSVVDRSDVFDVPDVIYETEYFDLTQEQKKAIQEVENNPRSVVHVVRWTHIHEIMGGTLKGEDNIHSIRNGKIPRLKEYAEQYKKFVVFCRYTAELEAIQRELGDRVVVVNGETTGRDEIFEKANQSDDTILTISAQISVGYNLPTYELVIFYSNDFSYINRIQAEGRVQRGEYRTLRTIIDFVVQGSVDEDVVNALKRKENFLIETYKRDGQKK